VAFEATRPLLEQLGARAMVLLSATLMACSTRNDSANSGSTSTITAPFLQKVELLVDNAARFSALKVARLRVMAVYDTQQAVQLSPADVKG
jgi:hypothetical protein